MRECRVPVMRKFESSDFAGMFAYYPIHFILFTETSFGVFFSREIDSPIFYLDLPQVCRSLRFERRARASGGVEGNATAAGRAFYPLYLRRAVFGRIYDKVVFLALDRTHFADCALPRFFMDSLRKPMGMEYFWRRIII